ncbi:MAG: hypothetical protein BGP10_14905 [Rhodanobacter sp. 68-29]|nr:pilin [Rhodanobacter sp.]ODU72662.1 MAG: hypothetical protein ABT17_14870 [Rhodanobacter sp. SCN 69-32]OJY61215.1 MAG: hypothetical protein BGP10_14905 [Rhodanobacter sp. 68-29]
MEHWVRLAYSNTFFYAAVFVFAFGVILWIAWSRFFSESDVFKKISQSVMGFAVLMLFAGGYASVVAKGLDGVVCAAARHSFHVTCHTRDESPLWFWGHVVVLTSFTVIFMLGVLVFLVGMWGTDERRATDGAGNVGLSGRVGKKQPVAGKTSRLLAFGIWAGAIVVSTLAWIAASLHHADGVRGQVIDALMAATPEKTAVETYLQDHGALPQDNMAMGLSPSVDMRDRHVSEVKIFKGSIMLKFDESVGAPLRGRLVMLIAVRRSSAVSWHCASPDIDDRFLPVACRKYSFMSFR